MDSKVAIPSNFRGYVFRTGGNCGTGVIRAGSTLQQVFELRYSPNAEAYVGVAAAFAYDKGEREPHPRITFVTAVSDARPGVDSVAAAGRIDEAR